MTALCLCLLPLAASVGCGKAAAPLAAVPASSANEPTTVLLSVTSDAQSDPQSVDMAMKLAGFSLDEGRRVVLFFNVKGVNFPTKQFPADFAFGEDKALKTQLMGLIERGVDVHVCPVCMKALGVSAEDIVEGAKVTTRPSLFANIGPSTVVFTY